MDNYLSLIPIFTKKSDENPDLNFDQEFFYAIKNSLIIGLEANYGLEKIESELKVIINELQKEDVQRPFLSYSILELVIQNIKKLDKSLLKTYRPICEKSSKNLADSENYHFAIKFLILGEKIAEKFSEDTVCWKIGIAKLFEKQMEKSSRKQSFLALDSCQKAIIYYKSLKEHEKVHELEQKLEQIKDKTEFKEYSEVVDLSETDRQCNEIAEAICHEPVIEILCFLINGSQIIPSIQAVKNQINGHNSIFIDIFPVHLFDENVNPVQKFTRDDEKQFFRFVRTYRIIFEMTNLNLIKKVIIRSVQQNNLNAKGIIDFLSRFTWYGEIQQKEKNKLVTEYRFIDIISPMINEYFYQFEVPQEENPYQKYILVINSMSLIIEGIVRSICERNDIPTTITKEEKDGKIKTVEGNIQNYLHDNTIATIINEDDLMFLRILLVEQAGYNLRHRVAHSLLLPHEFSFKSATLLFIAILRLAKYDMKIEKGESNIEPI